MSVPSTLDDPLPNHDGNVDCVPVLVSVSNLKRSIKALISTKKKFFSHTGVLECQ